MTESRLLVRGVNWLGDAVMTTPALQRLREALPGRHIALLTHRKLRDLWLNHPSIDEIIAFEEGESAWAVANRLRRKGFGTALVLPNSPRSALEVRLAGIPERIGYSRPWRNWFLTKAIPARSGRVEMRKLSDSEVRLLTQSPNQGMDAPNQIPTNGSAHQMHEYLNLAVSLGAKPEPIPPKLAVTDDEVRDAKQRWLSLDRNDDMTLIGLNPGAEYGPAKRWPAENFAAAVLKISQQRKNCVWLVFGGQNDRKLGDQIASLTEGKAVNIAGKTSLREFMALLKLCRVLLTNDTGPMHVAAALGTPVVVPFGSTSPELTSPGLPGDPRNHLLKGEAPCAPCFRRECPIDFRCMASITVDRVVKSILEALP
jgi:heptosyltransferase-2